MSNTFNISVKPEIAAAVAKIDVIDGNVDDILDPGLANLASAIANNAVDIGLIRSEDVPALDALIDINTAHLVTIDSLADAIKLKTDAMPQKVRGNFNYVTFNTIDGAFQTVLNITGQGKVQVITIWNKDSGDTSELRVTVDGEVFTTFSHTGDALDIPLQILAHNKMFFAAIVNEHPNIDIEFDTSLLIELRRSAGTADTVWCFVTYFLDDF